VDAISGVTPTDVATAAQSALHPEDASIVIVTDLYQHGAALQQLGRPIETMSVEF
jgi:hypothetical protein